ncbi:hypothetical protein BGX30_009740 [Mortierella sp. GBA39]|nr:hypothetical protein BGX30_009740 [Mortierella sp. GBA39]
MSTKKVQVERVKTAEVVKETKKTTKIAKDKTKAAQIVKDKKKTATSAISTVRPQGISDHLNRSTKRRLQDKFSASGFRGYGDV